MSEFDAILDDLLSYDLENKVIEEPFLRKINYKLRNAIVNVPDRVAFTDYFRELMEAEGIEFDATNPKIKKVRVKYMSEYPTHPYIELRHIGGDWKDDYRSDPIKSFNYMAFNFEFALWNMLAVVDEDYTHYEVYFMKHLSAAISVGGDPILGIYGIEKTEDDHVYKVYLIESDPYPIRIMDLIIPRFKKIFFNSTVLSETTEPLFKHTKKEALNTVEFYYDETQFD